MGIIRFGRPKWARKEWAQCPTTNVVPKPTAAAVGQAAFCLQWTQAAAARTASPARSEQELLLGIAPALSAPISGVQTLPRPSPAPRRPPTLPLSLPLLAARTGGGGGRREGLLE
eukprot:193006-Pyramimonas_sp.AAC.1